MSARFEFAVRHREAMAVIDLEGDIDAAAEEGLTAAYTAAIRPEGVRALVLNFTEVRYINSTGIALIVGLLAKARVSEHRVVAFGLSPHYRQIFEITRLADFLGIFTDEATALTAPVVGA